MHIEAEAGISGQSASNEASELYAFDDRKPPFRFIKRSHAVDFSYRRTS
ncbi:hypothetical protein BN2476_720051 [Paraburkholderia piptadeniae]|uniref:Uncharacterized protein n=1 Tax=Paraburkholderia piptadeniae TaxID=1701573 RepID=A0A1N7SR05_9BURK|nr:hypothetical protein BN2476_720051 [Paraburkholderia piptadeniae]